MLRRATAQTGTKTLRRSFALSFLVSSLALAACDAESPADDVGALDTGDPDTAVVDADPGDAVVDSSDAGATDVNDTTPEDVEVDLGPPPERAEAPENDGIYGFASGCYSVEAWTTYSAERGGGDGRWIRCVRSRVHVPSAGV